MLLAAARVMVLRTLLNMSFGSQLVWDDVDVNQERRLV